MSQDRFSLSESLFYSSPVKTATGELNYTEFQPQSGSTFDAGTNFSIRVSSPDSFIDPKKTWLKFTLTPAGATDAANRMSALGGAAVIKRIDTLVSGVEIESIDSYNHYVSMLYKRQPLTYLQLLRETEKCAYDGSAAVTIASAAGTSGPASRVVNHPLRVAIMEGHSNLIPVPFLRGGVEFRFTLESVLANVFTIGGTSITGYSISNVRLVCGMVKPMASYLQQFQQKLESGGEATLPIQIVRNLNFVPTASTSQESILTPGYLSSLRSVMGAYRTASAPGFNNDIRNNLTSYFWMIGSKRYPLNKQIATSDDDAENVMFALASIDNTYNHLRTPAATTGTGHLIYYNFCADSSFGNGEPCSDGQVRLIQTYSATPDVTGRVDFYVTYDAKLRVSAASVVLDALNV